MIEKLTAITQAELKSRFHYNYLTGQFTYLVNTTKNAIGDIVKDRATNAYLSLTINKVHWKAHRLAWLYVYGVLPAYDLDHIDRDKRNNAISNLREVTALQNSYNQIARANSSTGINGVKSAHSKSGFVATITVDGKFCHLGSFATLEEAASARRDAELQFFGEYAPEYNQQTSCS